MSGIYHAYAAHVPQALICGRLTNTLFWVYEFRAYVYKRRKGITISFPRYYAVLFVLSVLTMPGPKSSLRRLARSKIFVIVVSKDLLAVAVQQRQREVKIVQNSFHQLLY